MNIFKFTKLRKKLFIRFSIWFIGIPLLCIFALFLLSHLQQLCAYYLGRISFPFLMVSYGVTPFLMIVSMLFFFVPATLVHLLGFGEACFETEIFLTPTLLGWIVTIIFYFVIAFLLSWLGSYKKDNVKDENEKCN